jgi:hypothetical protein
VEGRRTGVALLVLASVLALTTGARPAAAQTSTASSSHVAIVGSAVSANGGILPTTGPAGELGAFTFTELAPSAVTSGSLAPYDTVVLNVASAAMGCNPATLSSTARSALVAFVGAGGKLIIYDSECRAANGGLDYTWLPYPFTTDNPGEHGAFGTLTVVEDNTLSSAQPSDPHFIDAAAIGSTTDAAGDANVMLTRDPHWCVDMAATNVNGAAGAVHTYAVYPAGTNKGLIIYNGLDIDFIGVEPTPPAPNGLRKIWLQELRQSFDPANLPCGVASVGITLSPATATNPVGTRHTVTARVTEVTGAPRTGVPVTFTVVSGPNAGTGGTCVPSTCATDAKGAVSFTYTGSGGVGTDRITACFGGGGGGGPTPGAGAPSQGCSRTVTKTWTSGGGGGTGGLKICKVAGEGVKVGTRFTFTAGGHTVTVPAGPAPGGYCVVAARFPLTTVVTVAERVPDHVAVSRIGVAPRRAVPGTTNVRRGTVAVRIGTGYTEVTFTDTGTGFLEICKAASGTGVKGSFTFTVAGRSATVPVGACSPAIELPAGPVRITEAAAPGTALAACGASPAGRLVTCSLSTRSLTVRIVAGNIARQTIARFTNRAVPGT